MKPPKLPDYAVTGTHMKMIGIGKLYLCLNLLQVSGRHRPLNGRRGAYIHKYRGLDSPMDRLEFSPFCPAFLF